MQLRLFLVLFPLLLCSVSYAQTPADATTIDTTVYTKTRQRGKVVVHTYTLAQTGRKVRKEKFKNSKLIYRVDYNEKGKIHQSTNKKGVTRIHKRPCNC